MFDALTNLATTQAVSAIHLAIRFLRHRTGDEGRVSEPVSPEALRAAKQILQQIEHAEQKDIQSFDLRKSEQYISRLADLAQQRLRDELRYDTAKGKILLEELRSR